MKRIQRDRDRISFLSDVLQSQILNFLPIREAFKSSILSSRWRNVSSFLSKLEFDQTVGKSNSEFQFNDIIDQVLRARVESRIDVMSLFLKIDGAPVSTHHVDDWICYATSHQVRTFTLENGSNSAIMYTVPSSLFTCTCLKSLTLMKIHITFPTATVCFPTLTKLVCFRSHLTDAIFSSNFCPVLVHLAILECHFDTLSISSSTLHYLRIHGSIGRPKINLSIPNLNHFDYMEKDLPLISLETLSSLDYARFRVGPQLSDNGDLAGKILKGMHNVSTLVLTEFFVEYLTINWVRCSRLLDYPAALCCNLKVLKLVYTSESHIHVLKLLLRSFRNLEDLELRWEETTGLPTDDNNAGGCWEEKEKLRGNILNRLNTVDFLDFRGKDGEFELAEFLVQYATELKEVNISGPPKEQINKEKAMNIAQKFKLYCLRRRGALPLQLNFITEKMFSLS